MPSIVFRRSLHYGFIGLGRMGLPMARNLQRSGEKVIMYDVKPPTGVDIAKTAQEVVDEADTIITMLPDGTTMKTLFQQITPRGKQIYIDCSTIDIKTSGELARKITHHNAMFVDAPVSGGVIGAQNGTLTFMVGLSKESTQLADVSQALIFMGKRIIACGSPTLGLAAKLSNNYLLAISNIATCEAMNLGLELGLEAKVLGEIINSSTGRCWASEANNPVLGVTRDAPVERGYHGGFAVELMEKDLKLACEAAKERGVWLGLKDAAQGVYAEVAESRRGKDFGVVYEWLQGGQKG